MAKQEQEDYDFLKFEEDQPITDFAFFEHEYLAPSPDLELAFGYPQQQLDLGPELTFEEVMRLLDYEQIEELKTAPKPESLDPPRVEEQQAEILDDEARKYRNEEEELIRGLEENERFLISDFPDPSFQRILFEINVADDHVEGGGGGGSAPKSKANSDVLKGSYRKRKRWSKGWRDSPEETKDHAIADQQQKIRNREAAARCYAKRKKHINNLSLQVEKLRMENKTRKKVVKFLEISKEVGAFPRRLARTTSGPIPSY